VITASGDGPVGPYREEVRRILVYGVTGSGKSTLARRIGERLGLPYHAVDDLTWEAGWVPVSPQVQRERITAICATDAWVIDSAYGIWLDVPLARADLIVGLDLPRWRSLGRLLRRTAGNVLRGIPTCNGNRETFRQSFLSRDSILWWHGRSFKRKRRRMRAWRADPAMPRVVLLSTPAAVERWVAGLPGDARRHAVQEAGEPPLH
jgi:adenylate kinase family enzyme